MSAIPSPIPAPADPALVLSDAGGLEIESVSFADADLSGYDLDDRTFRRVHFLRCRLSGRTWRGLSLIDCTLTGCDFSNSTLRDAYLCRTRLVDCKGLGLTLLHSLCRESALEGGVFRYLRAEDTDYTDCLLGPGDWREASCTDCRLKRVRLEELDLTRATFFSTPLAGIDLRSCTLDGLIVSDTLRELRGAVVTPLQAAALARLMGLIVR